MKITHIEPIHVAIPYEHGAPKPIMGNGTPWSTMQAVYVRVDTDAGVTGWGEAFGFAACPVTRAAVELAIAPLAIGRDPSDVPALMSDLYRRTQNMSHNGPVGFGLSGLDVALWDIAGKVAGKPVHQLLDPNVGKVRIPAYASLLRLNTPDNVERVCAQALERGYGNIKLHERTLDAVAAARRIAGPAVGLMLDTNCSWTPQEALKNARALQAFDLTWLEEPIHPADDYKALARLRKEGGVPIAAGENLGNLNDVERILEAGALDYVQPDAIKMGGITECWKALHLAGRMGVKAEPHSPFYGPGLIAAVHLIAAMAGEILCEFFYADLEESPIGDAGRPQHGHLHVPNGPGLGINVDEKILERYRVR
jgi:L-alanine-DL-glutamate epimerase-like enolase superfamily enzyme